MTIQHRQAGIAPAEGILIGAVVALGIGVLIHWATVPPVDKLPQRTPATFGGSGYGGGMRGGGMRPAYPPGTSAAVAPSSASEAAPGETTEINRELFPTSNRRRRGGAAATPTTLTVVPSTLPAPAP